MRRGKRACRESSEEPGLRSVVCLHNFIRIILSVLYENYVLYNEIHLRAILGDLEDA